MNRALAACILFWLCLIGAAAQDVPAPTPVKSGDVLRGHFVQTRQLKGFSKPLRTEGDFTVAPATGMIWNVTKPFATTIIATQAGLMQTSGDTKGGNPSLQKLPTASELYAMLNGLLSGDIASLNKNFRMDQNGRAAHWRLSLVPRRWGNPLMPFREIRVHGGRFVEQIDLIKVDGDSDTISFDGMSVGKTTLTANERDIFAQVVP